MTVRTHMAAFLTGHSVRGCTGLSVEQRDFQRCTDVPEQHWIKSNFPYHETFAFPESVGLSRASLNNVWHFVQANLPSYQTRHREVIADKFSRYDAVILLVGSCGMELLQRLNLPSEIRQRVHVFACGPVSIFEPSVASLVVVQGRHDMISRCFYPKAHHRIDCSHMGYLEARETLELFNAFYHRVLNPADLKA